MKGVVAVMAILVVTVLACSIAVGTPPLPEPRQYEQYCENQKVAGTGVIDISTSMVDKKIALEYYNVMSGDGDFELDAEHVLSENASKILRTTTNDSKEEMLNLFESSKMTYAGNTPLVGGKFLQSKAFYGGIGAQIQEMFAVTEMEKDQTVFFASTDPRGPWKDWDNGIYNESPSERELAAISAAHLLGMDSKNSFNGTWGTDSTWHKIFYKDIKDHQMFTGNFETEKLIKFHEAPFAEFRPSPCDGVDC